MKRITALFLTLLMLAGILSGCSLYYKLFGYDTEYKGEVYYMYFGDMPTTLDPKDAYIDDSTLALMSMVYAGLYKYEEDGSVTEDIAKSCVEKSYDETTGELVIEIEIKDTRWSDEVYVQADQFVYAWRRLLEPTSSSIAASILYDVKNAREIKAAVGSTTKYDLGVVAVDTRMLHITLQGIKLEDGSYVKPDVEAFKAKLASPLLVPLRSDKVQKLTYWATSNETVPSCGPFYLRTYNQIENTRTQRGAEIILQRNKYYLRDEEVDPIDKYVEPYQIICNYTIDKTVPEEVEEDTPAASGTPVFESAAEQALYYYEKGYIDYLSYIPVDARQDYKDKVVLHDTPYTHSYLFNTKNSLLSNAKVRRALSMALDRTELANRLVFARAARSIVAPSVFEKGVSGDAFIDHLTNSVSLTAQLDEAKALLKEAGVEGGSFTIAVKAGDEEALVAARYCMEVWNGLGFDVELYAPSLSVKSFQENDYDCKYDTYYECYKANGEKFNYNVPLANVAPRMENGFDIIAVDLFAATTDAFNTLAPYSKYFSGMALDMTLEVDEFDPSMPLGNYDSTRYNLCLQSAFVSPGKQTRANYLHAAEEQLMEDMPVMPLFYHQYSVLTSDNVKKISYGYGGAPRFADMTHKDYVELDMTQIKAQILEERRKELGI